MNTIIEQIKAEIERLCNEHPTEDGWDRGYNYACEEIMSFLSDLEKECEKKPNDQWSEEDEKMLSVISYKISQHQGHGERDLFTPEEAEFIGKIEDNLKSLRKEKSEKPTTAEGVEDVAGTLAKEHGFVKNPNFKPAKYSWSAVRDIFIEGVIAGAKWQEEQDLKYISEIYRNGYNLCKEQMMREAVEGEVVKDINNKLAVTAKNANLDKFKFGDKVRIIIIKEEGK